MKETYQKVSVQRLCIAEWLHAFLTPSFFPFLSEIASLFRNWCICWWIPCEAAGTNQKRNEDTYHALILSSVQILLYSFYDLWDQKVQSFTYTHEPIFRGVWCLLHKLRNFHVTLFPTFWSILVCLSIILNATLPITFRTLLSPTFSLSIASYNIFGNLLYQIISPCRPLSFQLPYLDFQSTADFHCFSCTSEMPLACNFKFTQNYFNKGFLFLHVSVHTSRAQFYVEMSF